MVPHTILSDENVLADVEYGLRCNGVLRSWNTAQFTCCSKVQGTRTPAHTLCPVRDPVWNEEPSSLATGSRSCAVAERANVVYFRVANSCELKLKMHSASMLMSCAVTSSTPGYLCHCLQHHTTTTEHPPPGQLL